MCLLSLSHKMLMGGEAFHSEGPQAGCLFTVSTTLNVTGRHGSLSKAHTGFSSVNTIGDVNSQKKGNMEMVLL